MTGYWRSQGAGSTTSMPIEKVEEPLTFDASMMCWRDPCSSVAMPEMAPVAPSRVNPPGRAGLTLQLVTDPQPTVASRTIVSSLTIKEIELVRYCSEQGGIGRTVMLIWVAVEPLPFTPSIEWRVGPPCS